MSQPVCSVHTAQIRGIEAVPISVEISISAGIPGFTIVGMPSVAVREAGPRVRSALKAAGFELPRMHLTINLAPGDFTKTGTGLDLAIALAVLIGTGQIPASTADKRLFVGELGLDGSVLEVRGALAYAKLASEQKFKLVAAPQMYPQVSGSNFIEIHSLADLKTGLSEHVRASQSPAQQVFVSELDYKDVYDQELAKRALVLCATGNHGLLMVGPPGAGKSMLAKRLPSILPALQDSEKDEALLIHSVAGLDTQHLVAGQRPFRAPHHSISTAGLIGGGKPLMPGELSLAHRGVLFLDELPEFATNVLQLLRQPLEEGEIRLIRADGTYRFPCEILLVAAANPCPCGHLGDSGHECVCSAVQIARYQSRIGGPLMDRIDMHVHVKRPNESMVVSSNEGTSSAEMHTQVQAGKEFALWRGKKDIGKGPLTKQLNFSSDAEKTLKHMAHGLAFGGRAITRTAKLARTISDVSQKEQVSSDDVLEACSFRAPGGM